ncbi:iron chelate uptake ABC transporter family permease subunit [Verminephrobacter aporrectodeae]|uniref:iron chelate uptake ABC transporter family permease subunit n=1 Tax=Verminephrobacter aporrectodeae TaxID=1110389 RepID=UPI002244D561|nr:iron chelate uptake ABC transporter family permease subunit [Verminephrobacter aporrectodeae]
MGPDHRVLLPASALVGGIFMVLVGTLARSLTSAEIPLDVITALIRGARVRMAAAAHPCAGGGAMIEVEQLSVRAGGHGRPLVPRSATPDFRRRACSSGICA